MAKRGKKASGPREVVNDKQTKETPVERGELKTEVVIFTIILMATLALEKKTILGQGSVNTSAFTGSANARMYSLK